MKSLKVFVVSVCLSAPLLIQAQQALPDAPEPHNSKHDSAGVPYAPPSQGERLKNYATRTFGPMAILEAGLRGGIEQARDKPVEWPQGGQGYADRFGSSMGQIAVRGTTEYVLSDLFKEDLRFISCRSDCDKSKFKAALEDTFLARKGIDGHESLSVARLVGPWSGAAVAVSTWYPSGYGGSEVARQALLSYGVGFLKNYIRELAAH